MGIRTNQRVRDNALHLRDESGFLAQGEGGGDGGGDGFFEGGGVAVTLPAGGGGVERVDLDDAHAGVAEFLEGAAALGGDLFGAHAGVFGGFAHHLDFGFAGLGVDEVHALGGEGDAVFEEADGVAGELGEGVHFGGADFEVLADAVAGVAGDFALVGFDAFVEFGDLHGFDDEVVLVGGLEERGDAGEIGLGAGVGFGKGGGLGGEAGAPDGEVGADVFAGGTGDVDHLIFADTGPGAGEGYGGETKAGGEGQTC